MDTKLEKENSTESQLPPWFTEQIAEFNIEQTWLKVAVDDQRDLGKAYQFLTMIKDWKVGRLPESQLAKMVSKLGAKKVTEHLSAIEVLVGLPKNSGNSIHLHFPKKQFILPPTPPQPLTEADIAKLTKTLIDEVGQHYKKNHSILIPVLHTETGTSILEAYVNLAIVKEVKANNQNDQTEFKEKRYLNSHEQIYGKKSELKISDLFKPIEKEEDEHFHGKIPSRILVEGWAGSGKSVFCQFIANKLASSQEKASEKLWGGKFELILWIPLRNLSTYTQRAYSLADVVKAECLPNDSNISIDEIAAVLKQMGQRVLLVIDGFDEAVGWYHETNKDHGHPKQWSYRCQLLRSLTDQDTHPFIATSRPHFVDNTLRQQFDRRLETIGFKDEDIDNYIKAYFHRLNRDERGEALLNEMQVNSVLREAAYVPVNLSLICLIWNSQPGKASFPGQLTTTRLYSEIVLCLLRRDYSARLVREGKLLEDGTKKVFSEDEATLESLNWEISDFEDDLDYGQMLQWLEEIAWKNQSESREHNILMPGEALYNFLKGKGIPPNQILTKIKWLKKLGLLNERYPGIGIRKNDYFFPHLTFQEYFAALHCVRQYLNDSTKSQAENAIQDHKYDKRYQIVLRFVAGLIDIRKPIKTRDYFDILIRPPIEVTGFQVSTLAVLCLHETTQFIDIMSHNASLKKLVNQYLLRCLLEHTSFSVSDELNVWKWCWRVILYYENELLSAFDTRNLLGYEVKLTELFGFIGNLPRASEKLLDKCLAVLATIPPDKYEYLTGIMSLAGKSDDFFTEKRFNQYLGLSRKFLLNLSYFNGGVKASKILQDWLWSKLTETQKEIWIDSLIDATKTLSWAGLIVLFPLIRHLPWDKLNPSQKNKLIDTLTKNDLSHMDSGSCLIRVVGELREKQLLPKDTTIDFDLYSRGLESEHDKIKSEAIRATSLCPIELLPQKMKDKFTAELRKIKYNDITMGEVPKMLLSRQIHDEACVAVCDLLSDSSSVENLRWICELPEDIKYFQPRSGYFDQLISIFSDKKQIRHKYAFLKMVMFKFWLKFSTEQKARILQNLQRDLGNDSSRSDVLDELSGLMFQGYGHEILSDVWSEIKKILPKLESVWLCRIITSYAEVMDFNLSEIIINRIFKELAALIKNNFNKWYEVNAIQPYHLIINQLPLNRLTPEERLVLLNEIELYGIEMGLDSVFNRITIDIFIKDGPSKTLCKLLYCYAIKYKLLIKTQTEIYMICDQFEDPIVLPDTFTPMMDEVGESLKSDSSQGKLFLFPADLKRISSVTKQPSPKIGLFSNRQPTDEKKSHPNAIIVQPDINEVIESDDSSDSDDEIVQRFDK